MIPSSLTPYRKLLVYLGMALFVILNEIVGLNLDEDAYATALKEGVNLIIMLVGGWGVFQARNDPQ